MSRSEHRFPIALTIAGSDSGGGAGIQADLKTFHRFGVYGTSALTLVTAQNTRGVRSQHPFPPAWIDEQIAAVVEDLGCDAAKTGALGSREAIECVAAAVRRFALHPLVVDPVMIATSGDALLEESGVDALREKLVPLATLVTPNLAEAEALTGLKIGAEADLREAARRLHGLGAAAVLVKGGHGRGAEAVDLLFDGREFVRIAEARVDTRHTHGTGCTLSAAITAGLARGETLLPAVRAAKAFVTRALATAPGFGSGHGPLNHWA